MMLQGHDDSTLMVIFLTISIVVPFIVLWFDDAKMHGK